MEFTFYWNWLKMLNKQITDNWNTVVFQFVVKCSVEKYWIGEGEGMPWMIQLLKNIYLFTSWVLFQHEGSSVFITAFKLSCGMWSSSLLLNCSVVSNSLEPHGLKHTGLPVHHQLPESSNACPLSWWCHPTISSSIAPFSSLLQSFPASGSFQMSQFFASSGQSIEVSASASVLPMNIQDWSPLGWTGWISLQSKGLSRVFSNITIQKHQFFGAHLYL